MFCNTRKNGAVQNSTVLICHAYWFMNQYVQWSVPCFTWKFPVKLGAVPGWYLAVKATITVHDDSSLAGSRPVSALCVLTIMCGIPSTLYDWAIHHCPGLDNVSNVPIFQVKMVTLWLTMTQESPGGRGGMGGGGGGGKQGPAFFFFLFKAKQQCDSGRLPCLGTSLSSL